MSLYVVISIDLETPQSPMRRGDLKQALLDPVADGMECGYSFILRTLGRYKVPGVFFINTYESSRWGEGPYEKACRDITEAGCEIGLHTHPEWSFDAARIHMWQYSLDEQMRIVAHGLESIGKWLPGYRVTSHRAGAYGIDEQTMDALSANGIPVDSSAFFGHSNCRAHWKRNAASVMNGILEIPVTIHEIHTSFTLAGWTVLERQTTGKADINWASLEELLFLVDEARRSGLSIFNLFMHSYSFIRSDKGYCRIRPDQQCMEKFVKFLAAIVSDPCMRVVTMKDLYELHQQNPGSLSGGNDHVPVCHRKMRLTDRVLEKIRDMRHKVW